MIIIDKIHQFATHPVGMLINVGLALEIFSRTALNHPIAILIIWFIINFITGWRIMNKSSNLYFTYHEWKRNTQKFWLLLFFSIISLIILLLIDEAELLIWSSSIMGIIIVYLMRNYDYKKKFSCLWNR
jgi:hypothetical protein